MAGHEVLLSVDGVVMRYGAMVALDDVGFTLRCGEFVALLGPNGAGKSTLMQLLTGQLAAQAGTIRVLGWDVARDAVRALAHIGVVFQQPTLDPELSVRANLLFHTDLHGLDRAEARRRIERELERLALAAHSRAPVRKLSGGNRRRVELARALLHAPELILMDEPTVGLDPASRAAILDHVPALRRSGAVGVLWATHLVDEAEAADRLLVLHRGRVQFDGPPAALLADQGATSLAAAFLRLTGVEPGTLAEMTR